MSYMDARARANPHTFMRACEWARGLSAMRVKMGFVKYRTRGLILVNVIDV